VGMKKNIIVVVLLFCVIFLAGTVNAAGGWNKVKESNGIKLYERSVPGTDLKEFMAVTVMDAKMEVIGEALRDVPRYTEWQTDTESVEVVKKYDRNTLVTHIIQDPPVVEKRDIVVKNETLEDYENGRAVITFHSTGEVNVPLNKKHVRITEMSGLFQMEYIGRNKTKFIYKLKADPAGSIPKKLANATMKYYPYDSLKHLKKIITDGKYADLARGSDDERKINIRSTSEDSVRKIYGESMMRVVKNKAAMAAILAADHEGMKRIAASGSAYDTIKKTATESFSRYIDKMVTDKKVQEKLRNNEKLHAEITDLVQTINEAEDTTVDSIVARYIN
jgi:hypothetical protein